MARQETVTLVDDLDGSEADRTVEFGLDGKTYEIDLSSTNAGKLRESLAPFVEAARKAGRPSLQRVSTPKRAGGRSKEELAAIRAWAASQGLVVSARGRIATEVMEKFDAAHDGATSSAPAVTFKEAKPDSEEPLKVVTDAEVKAWWEMKGFAPMKKGVTSLHRQRYQKDHPATTFATNTQK